MDGCAVELLTIGEDTVLVLAHLEQNLGREVDGVSTRTIESTVATTCEDRTQPTIFAVNHGIQLVALIKCRWCQLLLHASTRYQLCELVRINLGHVGLLNIKHVEELQDAPSCGCGCALRRSCW